MLECHPIQKFHDDERRAVLFANVVEGADIRMSQCGGGARFAAEALQCHTAVGGVWGKELKSDKSSQQGVFRFINHTHATAAQLFLYAVMRDGLANHWERMLLP